jgi:hypothetical protein
MKILRRFMTRMVTLPNLLRIDASMSTLLLIGFRNIAISPG